MTRRNPFEWRTQAVAAALAISSPKRESELRRLTRVLNERGSITELGVSECAASQRSGTLSDRQVAYLAGRHAAVEANTGDLKRRELAACRQPEALRDHFRLGWVDASISLGATGDSAYSRAARLQAAKRGGAA